jgi:hypothetical protein
MGKIGREPITEINSCRCKVSPNKGCAHSKLRLRKEMRVILGRRVDPGTSILFQQCSELGMGTSKSAGDVENVSSMRAEAAKRAAAGCSADENNICNDEIGRRFGGVTASKRSMVLLSESMQTGEKSLDPVPAFAGLEQRGRKGERKEGSQRPGAHRGEIAETASEATIAYGERWVDLSTKVPVLKGEVCGDEDLMSRGRAKDGAVITNPESESFAVSGIFPRKGTANLLD